jgi:hypothetical protein
VAATTAQLTAAGLLIEGKILRISPAGRERLNTLLADERYGTDAAAIAAACHDFRVVNTDFKPVVREQAHRRRAQRSRRRRPRRRGAASARPNPRAGRSDHRRGGPADPAAKRILRQAGLRAGEGQARPNHLVDPPCRRLIPHRVVRTTRGTILAAGLTRDAEAKADHTHNNFQKPDRAADASTVLQPPHGRRRSIPRSACRRRVPPSPPCRLAAREPTDLIGRKALQGDGAMATSSAVAHPTLVTSPDEASTSTKCPVRRTRLPTIDPTTHGIPNSRATTAACDISAPVSTTTAAA